MKLRKIAHSRTGDKGNISNISVIVFDQKDYQLVEKYVTAEAVGTYFSEFVKGKVIRYALPNVGAFNFVMYDALGGGVTRTLALDIHGKSISSAIGNFELPDRI
jgi:hypothetical protein